MKYEFIEQHEYLFPIEKMCRCLEVGLSGYYKCKSSPICNRLLLKEKMKKQITYRNFTVAAPSDVWVSGVTYIQTNERFLYLAAVIDLYDRM